MNYLQFFDMRAEVSLMALILIVFLYDLFTEGKERRGFHALTCVLLGIHTLLNICPGEDVELFGGMYQSYAMTNIMKTILSIGTLLVFLQAKNWLRRDDTRHKEGEFYVLTLCTLLGMNFMMSAGNFLMFFIGLELASIPMACLVAMDKYKHESAEAGAKYIMNAMFSSGLMLYGISFVYGTVGTLYFNDIPTMLEGTPMQILALVFFFAGLGFKLSLVPFHLWTADTYQGAPTAVTSYLSVVSKGAAAFTLLVILMNVFGPMVEQWQTLLYAVIIITITLGNLMALKQENLKRFMAFSSISQAGYIMLGVIGGNELGMTSLVFYVLVYIAANLAAFTVINVIEQKAGKVDMSDYNGLYQTNPKLSFLMTLALFSLAGIPPFAGFFSKFFIFASAFSAGFYLVVFIALLNTIISLFYYLKIVKAMYITPNDAPIAAFSSDCSTKLSLALCTAGIIALGLVSAIYDGLNLYAFGM